MAGHAPKSPRIRRRLCLYFHPVGSQDRPRPGFTEDLSTDGVFVQTTKAYGAGTHLEMEFATPDGPVTVRGKVMWAKRAPASLVTKKRSGMGIRLEEVPPELLALTGAS
jgi:hypothetical protein